MARQAVGEMGKQLVYVNNLPPKNEENKDEEKKKEESSEQKTVEQFIEENAGLIEGLALFNLDKDRPIIPLKILFKEL